MASSQFMISALLIVLCFSCIQSRKTNFVIFLVDDLGIGDVGCFGNDTIKTPSVDRIAAEGAKLTHSLSAESMCTPSRAALLTGRYPIRSGMASPGNEHRWHVLLSTPSGLPSNETTFAKVLQQNGYKTGAIGKWHLGLGCEKYNDFCHHPLNHGFDYFYGLPLTNLRDCDLVNDVYQHLIPNHRLKVRMAAFMLSLTTLALYMFNIISKRAMICLLIFSVFIVFLHSVMFFYWPRFSCVLMKDFEVIEQPIVLQNLTLRLTTEAIRFMERSSQEPFLLFMSFAKVHTALFTSEQFSGHSVHGEYGDNVEEMDWSVGKILESLEKLGLKEDTFVYLTSDNGGHVEEISPTGKVEGGWNGIYKGGKGQTWEGGIRMPTVAMWPGHIPKGVEVSEPVNSMDIFTTVLNIAKAPIPTDRVIDGKDMMPLLSGQSQMSSHKFMFHYCGMTMHAVRYRPDKGNAVWKAMFRSPKWSPGAEGCFGYGVCRCYSSKFVHHHNPPLLYNLSEDPRERNPISSEDPNFAPVIDEIKKALAEHEMTVEQVPNQMTENWPHHIRVFNQPCCNPPFCYCQENVTDLITP